MWQYGGENKIHFFRLRIKSKSELSSDLFRKLFIGKYGHLFDEPTLDYFNSTRKWMSRYGMGYYGREIYKGEMTEQNFNIGKVILNNLMNDVGLRMNTLYI